ncbi:hypothetical protein [Mucilaginibacter auburnensis]|uniref:Uncharacterized protein n=1 Tax=Mucilaginibacter auburnensis TaxID=1457233 RepID=A0A2H9VNW8_9SPHI|nr:hypothetical protein [Mucilaginibacter auburnensis]PJJ80016.1 hypothetical protein CLV57_3159 [Mucilaginibacter auburnensis]
MKTLTHILRLSLVAVLLTGINACKKNDGDSVDLKAGGTGRYTFGDITVNATRADYLLADGNAYVYIYGEAATDIMQLRFDRVAGVPEGTFNYLSSSNANYNPKYHFSGGSITTVFNPGSLAITAGEITISKSGDSYTIKFSCTIGANLGRLKGSYTGKLTSR